MKILIIDDDEMNLKILLNILQDAEYETLATSNAEDGFNLLKNHRDIQIILLDRMMPKMDGMAFLTALKSLDDLQPCKVIMQTAANEPRDVIEGNAAGVYYYLTKPFDEEMVLSVVSSAISDLKSLAI